MLTRSDFEKIAKGTVNLIDKGYHDKVIPGYSLAVCLRQPVDIEFKIISFELKEVAWHSQDWPKGCNIFSVGITKYNQKSGLGKTYYALN